jgi:hypothetical protein
MRGKIWIGSFIIIVVLAMILIFTPASDTFTGITIEMWGAFIGVFAAVSLGEIIKTYEDYRIAVRVRKHLVSEVRNILENIQQHKGTVIELGTNFWDASVASGDIAKLDDNLLLAFSVIYTKVGGHNRTARHFESMFDHPNASPEDKKQYFDTAIRSLERLELVIKNVLGDIVTNQVEDIAGFYE